MRNSYFFIINSSAGKGRAGRSVNEYFEAIRSMFPGSEILVLGKEDSIEEHAVRAAQKFDYVIAAGGDGTVQQVVRGIVGTDAVLGVLPMGSGNDFAKSVGMDLSFKEALEVLQRADINKIDIIQSGSELFLNTFGVGVDGLTNYYAARNPFKNATIRYFISGCKALFFSEKFRFECVIDGDRLAGKSWMIVVANGKTEGGRYKISPESDNTDGMFEVVIVRDISLKRLLMEFVKLSLGIPFDKEVVIKRNCRSSLSLSLDRECYAHIDGEIIPPTSDFHFSIRRKALPVITGT